ncbi:MAG: hypothetical protein ACOCQD_05125, partial [archaeon]
MSGYTFRGAYPETAPRKTEYTFYIAAKDKNGNYSQSNKVTVQHPGIQKLQQPDVKVFFEAFVIELPDVLTKFSKQEVYPFNNNTEVKDLLGYVVRLKRLDDGEGDDFEDEIEKTFLPKSKGVTVEVPSKSQWEITVGAFDSVYHPDHNPELFESTFSDPLVLSARQINDIVDFADKIRPVLVVEGFPPLPDEDHPVGSIIFHWEEQKLYKSDGNNWISVVNAGDLDGQITRTQISDDSISTPKLQSNAITSDKIATNAITAGKISAGAIGADEIAANAIIGEKIASNEIFAHHIQVDDLASINATFSGSINAPDMHIFESNTGGVIEMFHGQGEAQIVHLGNRRDYEGTNDTGTLVLMNEQGEARVGLSVSDSENDYGFLTLGRADIENEDEPLSSQQGLFLRGGHGNDGSLIRLRDADLNESISIDSNSIGNIIDIQDYNNPSNRAIRLYSNDTQQGMLIYLNGSLSGSLRAEKSNNLSVLSVDTIFAESKNFCIKHPTPGMEEYYLIHSTVESPTEGENMYRYSVDVGEEL